MNTSFSWEYSESFRKNKDRAQDEIGIVVDNVAGTSVKYVFCTIIAVVMLMDNFFKKFLKFHTFFSHNLSF